MSDGQNTFFNKLRIPTLLLILLGGLGFVYYYYVLRKKKAPQSYDTPVIIDNGPSQLIHNSPQSSTVIEEKKEPPFIHQSILHEPTKVSSRADGENRDCGFVFDDGTCCVIGSSVIGKNHIAMHLPCQDSCGYDNLGKGWGIAVTSDGAGSAEHSEVGSKVIVLRAIDCFK